MLPSGHCEPSGHCDPSSCCDNFTSYKNKVKRFLLTFALWVGGSKTARRLKENDSLYF